MHMHHDHGAHDHAGHSHSAKGIPKRRLLQAMGISLIITVAQVVGGIISGSLALMSDALHTATDAVALVISFVALKLGERPGTVRHTFGFKRAEILAAALNAGVLIGISLWLIWEAIVRFIHPENIKADWMIGVAFVGLVANVVNAILLQKGAKDNINMRSAYLHVLSDAVVSVGVILGGIAILTLGWNWIDPLLTLLISFWLIRASWEIFGESISIVMMSTPKGMNVEEITDAVANIEGVKGVHHVHLWQLNDQNIHFEAHLDVENRMVSETAGLIDAIEDLLHDRYEITHVTIQCEAGRCRDTRPIAEHE